MFIRSDHLQSMINYCLLAAKHDVKSLAFDANSNQQDLNIDEMISVLESYQAAAEQYAGCELKITEVTDEDIKQINASIKNERYY